MFFKKTPLSVKKKQSNWSAIRGNFGTRKGVHIQQVLNWNLKMLLFEERGKLDYPEKNLLEQYRVLESVFRLLSAWLHKGPNKLRLIGFIVF